MSGRGNSAAANRAQLKNGTRKTATKKNYNYYVVFVGRRPGVYKTWSECEDAIGPRDSSVRKPTWRGFYNKKDAEKCFKMFQHKEFTSRCANPQRTQAATPLAIQQPSTPPAAPVQQKQKQTTLDNAVAAVKRKLDGHPTLAAGADAFVNNFNLDRDDEGRIVVYTFGLFLKGLNAADDKVTAGVWFGQQSQLNSSLPCLEKYRHTKKDSELLAAVFALKIAASAGIQSVSIHSQSKFLINRAKTNETIKGASHSLLTELRQAAAKIHDVSWVLCKKNVHGAKEAETLAKNEALAGAE